MSESGYYVWRNCPPSERKKANQKFIGQRQRKPRTTQPNSNHRFESNMLDQDFDAPYPDAIWLTDITYILTREGYLYVAGILDLYTRQIVGLTFQKFLAPTSVL